eukprot:1977328-Rhodomonas_salina.2
MAMASGVLLSAYAMSGTDLAYGAICLRDMPLSAYAKSGTDLAYGAITLRTYLWCYAKSGTDLAYGATRWTTASHFFTFLKGHAP